MKTVLGILGGTGLYEMDGVKNIEKTEVETPWGKPSGPLVTGELNGIRLVFLSRHGVGHFHSPSDINYRANIDALKRAGVTDILSISACGSLRENLHPGMFVLVDQFIDHTVNRPKSFFGTGLVAHVSMAKPTCTRIGELAYQVLQEEKIDVHSGGTYIAIEGPQFSSYAESMMFRSWGADVIGMTNMPEAKLAREAEMCYQTVAMVTDFDCWHQDHAAVDVQSVLAVLKSNSEKAKVLIHAITKKIDAERIPCSQGCDHALDMALVTAKSMQNPDLVAKVAAILARKSCL